jgi:hypothetical protein
VESATFGKRSPFYHFMFTSLYQIGIIREVLGKIWFVWIGKRLDNAFNAVSYVARYTKRPPIAESSILEYDGQSVLFTFVEHKTQKRQCLMHIPHPFGTS